MRESDIERHVIEYARKNGFWCRKFTSPHRRSVPDYILAKSGVLRDSHATFFIEFKRPGEKPTPLQQREHDDMRAHGLKVYVIDNRDAGRTLIDGYDEALGRRAVSF